MTHRVKPRRTNYGLTRVELLVVVILLILILSMVIPPNFFSRGHLNMTRTVQCCNNLRQLGVALQLYSSEHYFGTLPNLSHTRSPDHPDARAAELGLLYLSGKGLIGDAKVFRCPGVYDDWTDPNPGTIDTDAECSYGWQGSHRLTVAAPPNMIILADEPAKDGAGNPVSTHSENHPESIGWNCLYKDTHVMRYKTVNPQDDADDGGIYERNGDAATDTWLR